MRRRVRGVFTAAILVLGVVGCSGGDRKGEAMTAPTRAASPGSGGASAQGKVESVSVAGIVLPSALDFERAENSTDPELDEVTWTATSTGAQAPACRVILGVQSNYPGDMEAYRAYLGDVLGLTDIEDDPEAPDPVAGVVANGSGGSGTPEDPSFRSVLRTWVTPGRTKITVSVATAIATAPECDPEAVVGTLTWDGTERPVASEGSVS